MLVVCRRHLRVDGSAGSHIHIGPHVRSEMRAYIALYSAERQVPHSSNQKATPAHRQFVAKPLRVGWRNIPAAKPHTGIDAFNPSRGPITP
jgi:hypothetical protein